MTVRQPRSLIGLFTVIFLGLAAGGAIAQDHDNYITQAKAFGVDIGHASFCKLDGEKLQAFASAGMGEKLPSFDDEEFDASILAEFEEAMRDAAETEPKGGCDAHLEKIEDALD